MLVTVWKGEEGPDLIHSLPMLHTFDKDSSEAEEMDSR